MEKLEGKRLGIGDDVVRRLEELEKRIADLESTLSSKGVNGRSAETHPLYQFCRDENERKIVEYLIKEGGATTRELEKVVGLKRRQILNRLRELASRAEEQLGRPALVYVRARVKGKRQAWWLNDA